MPTYTHDCEKCISLGGIQLYGSPTDLYVCFKASYASIVARYGSEPWEYTSAPANALRNINPEHEPALAEGLRRAEALEPVSSGTVFPRRTCT